MHREWGMLIVAVGVSVPFQDLEKAHRDDGRQGLRIASEHAGYKALAPGHAGGLAICIAGFATEPGFVVQNPIRIRSWPGETDPNPNLAQLNRSESENLAGPKPIRI